MLGGIIFILLVSSTISKSQAQIVLPQGQPNETSVVEMPLEGGAAYSILNKGNGMALTIDSNSLKNVPVFTRNYTDTKGQHWRLQTAYIGSSFKLIPTLNEYALLDLDDNSLGFWGRFFASQNQRFWNIIKVIGGESDVYKIQNWELPELCLESVGMDKEVNLTLCQDKTTQQWRFNLTQKPLPSGLGILFGSSGGGGYQPYYSDSYYSGSGYVSGGGGFWSSNSRPRPGSSGSSNRFQVTHSFYRPSHAMISTGHVSVRPRHRSIPNLREPR